MNKVFASAVLTAAVLASQAFADTITKNDGQVLEKVTVSKIGVREIEYSSDKRKKVVYAINKLDVAKITFKDGTEEVFPIKERRRGRDGEEFGRPHWGKGPGPRGEFRGGPGKFRDGAELGDPNGPPPPPTQGQVVTPPPTQGQAVVPPPTQGHAVTPPPAQGHAVTPAPAKTEPAPAAQPAKTEPAKTEPAKTQPAAAPAQSAAPATQPAAQPAKAEPAKTQPAAAPAQPAPAQPAR